MTGRRTCDCVCGGAVMAFSTDEAAVVAAVQTHQRSGRHQAWQVGQQTVLPCVGYNGRGCLAMVPADRLRCTFCASRLRESAA